MGRHVTAALRIPGRGRRGHRPAGRADGGESAGHRVPSQKPGERPAAPDPAAGCRSCQAPPRHPRRRPRSVMTGTLTTNQLLRQAEEL
ncbi:hypothetical protein GZL_01277 [Streptomyces sp. 769]|nr:hypothetical protein GZL_01277 [Streptomyces sp. 769]